MGNGTSQLLLYFYDINFVNLIPLNLKSDVWNGCEVRQLTLLEREETFSICIPSKAYVLSIVYRLTVYYVRRPVK